MIEPLRSQYLAALGIDNYAPRFILPGAKSSEPCEWLEIPADAVSAIPFAEEIPLAEEIARAQEEREERIAPAITQRALLIETESKRAPRIEAPTKPVVNENAVGPQFALSIVIAAGGILLIDSAPASNADRTAFQQMLNNLLPKLRAAPAPYSEGQNYMLDIFVWPLTRQPKVPRDSDAAIETLAAYLNKQIKQRAIDTVLLLGENAQRWSRFDENGLRIVKSTSLLACVRAPALKRPLWNDIRHLAES